MTTAGPLSTSQLEREPGQGRSPDRDDTVKANPNVGRRDLVDAALKAGCAYDARRSPEGILIKNYGVLVVADRAA